MGQLCCQPPPARRTPGQWEVDRGRTNVESTLSLDPSRLHGQGRQDRTELEVDPSRPTRHLGKGPIGRKKLDDDGPEGPSWLHEDGPDGSSWLRGGAR